MARRHAAAGGIVLLILLMLLVAWPQRAAAQDGGQDQANGQDESGAVSPRIFLPLASNRGLVQGTPDTSIWSDAVVPASIDSAQRWVVPAAYRLVSANMARLDTVLDQAPTETEAGVAAASSSNQTVLQLPLPDGTLQRFAVVESPIMAPELAARYPEITTYEARGIDDPTATARLDRTPAGFHAMILSGSDTVFIDPYLRGNDTLYASYYRSDYGNYYGKVRDEIEPIAGPLADAPANATGGIQAAQSGPTMRTYRMALAADGEYTQFYGGTVSTALAGMTTTINRVTGIYRRDLGIQFQLIANTDALIYTDPNTDPYTDSDGSAMLDQNQANLDAVIGSANYDIGHVFSTGGGGIAGLGVVCNGSSKAHGVTGSGAPIGDAYDVDYVAHEIGHQFNADHTFNNNSVGSCAGNRNSSTAVEPGSGSTIMAYAGICLSQNLQSNSDDQFSAMSILEINNYVTADPVGSSCAATTATGNSAPTVNAGPGFTIPRQTPFTLTGAGTDPDGNALTYSWEELDLGNAWANDGVMPNNDADSARPIFRVYRPVASPARTFPTLSSILDGSNSNPGEALPAISRTMSFRLTARDGLGGVNDSTTTVTVDATSGPFAVTAPNTAVSWNGGDSQAVTWNVANTTAAPVNCANVNILFSTDGGQTFPTTLAANTPNDGSETITVPGVNTTTGRVKVACAGSIFFDIGDANLTVATANAADLEITKGATPDPVVAGSPLTYQINVINHGPATAQAVSVVDTLPAGVTLTSATASQGSCSGPTTVTCAIGTLANGASASVTIVANVDAALVHNAGAAATITNNASVSNQITDPNTNNDIASVTTNVVAQADLAIVSFGAVTPPAEITVGQDTALLLRKVITNNGPSAPMDAALTRTGAGPADTAVTPGTATDQALAVALNEQRSLDENYTVRCDSAGPHTFTFASAIQPLRQGDTDTNGANNTASVDVSVNCVVPVALADFAIASLSPLAPPQQVIVGQDVSLLLRKVITNNGPLAPADAQLTQAGTGPADTTVTPPSATGQALAIALNEQRTLDENYTVRCSGAGLHTFTFTNEIQPLVGTDANGANNKASVDVAIDCIMPVALNIKPGSFPNSINTRKNGVIPVGVLTTKAGEYSLPLAFDASKIDPRTVRFGPRDCVWAGTCGAYVVRRSWEIENIYELNERTKDRDKDLLLNFLSYDARIAKGMTEACVKGTYVDAAGTRRTFFGCDSIRTVN